MLTDNLRVYGFRKAMVLWWLNQFSLNVGMRVENGKRLKPGMKYFPLVVQN